MVGQGNNDQLRQQNIMMKEEIMKLRAQSPGGQPPMQALPYAGPMDQQQRSSPKGNSNDQGFFLTETE